tara:strand:+ start:79529 stop:80491 length:963 start_codon:yes stop_codon:yes gene_type:complete
MELNINCSEEENTRLDKYIFNKLKSFSRTQIQSWIKNGLVIVNNSRKKASYRLELSDKVSISVPVIKDDIKLKPEKIKFDIIHEDNDIIILNKPSGLVVHPGNGNKSKTLVNGLLYHFSSLSDVNGIIRPGIVHRLDANTSGIMIVAKTNSAHISIANQFENRTIKKEYNAITWGNWKIKKGEINQPISRKRKDPTKFTVDETGKKSVTKFKVVKQLKHLAEIKFKPKTGRTHQIRVHANWFNHPLFGDEKYGGGIQKTKGLIPELKRYYQQIFKSFGRHALHAYSLEFSHPRTGKKMTFQVPNPDDYNYLINKVMKLDE